MPDLTEPRAALHGAAGLKVASTNLPDVDWTAYVDRLRQVADRFPPRPSTR